MSTTSTFLTVVANWDSAQMSMRVCILPPAGEEVPLLV